MATGPNYSISVTDIGLDNQYLSWHSRRPHLFRPRSAAATPVPMAPASLLPISASADGQECGMSLPITKIDAVLPKSIISRAKAVKARGAMVALAGPEVLIDARGVTYHSTTTVTLRWFYTFSVQSSAEIFYIVDNISHDGKIYDAFLRHDIRQPPNRDVPQARPCFVKPETSKQREERLQRDKELQVRREKERLAQARIAREKENHGGQGPDQRVEKIDVLHQ